jgi:hypothetical protein
MEGKTKRSPSKWEIDAAINVTFFHSSIHVTIPVGEKSFFCHFCVLILVDYTAGHMGK